MEYLRRYYVPIGGAEFVHAIQGHARLPSQAVLVTFDDGYRDFSTAAWPILRRHGVPAVLFVPTAFPDSARRFYWDVVYETITHTATTWVRLPGIGELSLQSEQARGGAIQRINGYLCGQRPAERDRIVGDLERQLGAPPADVGGVLTWEELRQLARAGVTIAPHTQTHAALPSLATEELIEEIERSHADFQTAIGELPSVFSYPYGRSDARAFPHLRSKGIVASFTADPALNVLGVTHPLLMHRCGVTRSASFTEFCLSLTSLYAAFRSQPYVHSFRRRVRRWAPS